MGTNYYLKTNVCPHCGREERRIHIGKSSCGWCFALRIYPEDGIHDLADWEPLFAAGLIFNEYGEQTSTGEMLATIRDRKGPEDRKNPPYGYSSLEEFFSRNYAVMGPHNLLRSRVCGETGCVKHGEGTWDCIVGEFS